MFSVPQALAADVASLAKAASIATTGTWNECSPPGQVAALRAGACELLSLAVDLERPLRDSDCPSFMDSGYIRLLGVHVPVSYMQSGKRNQTLMDCVILLCAPPDIRYHLRS